MEYLGLILGEGSSWFWAMCQFIVITITLIMIYQQTKSLRKSNMLQTLQKSDDIWNSKLLMKCRVHAADHFINNHLDLHEEEVLIINFFEDLGMYVNEGVL